MSSRTKELQVSFLIRLFSSFFFMEISRPELELLVQDIRSSLRNLPLQREIVGMSLVEFSGAHDSFCRSFITLLGLCLIPLRCVERLDPFYLLSFLEELIAYGRTPLSAWGLLPLFAWGRLPQYGEVSPRWILMMSFSSVSRQLPCPFRNEGTGTGSLCCTFFSS